MLGAARLTTLGYSAGAPAPAGIVNRYGFPITVSGPDITLTTAQKKFDLSSIDAPSTNTGYVETQFSPESPTLNFTIEGWFRLNAAFTGYRIFMIGNNSVDYSSVVADGNITMYFRNTGTNLYAMEYVWQGENYNGNLNGASGTILPGNWYHFAVVRNGPSMYIYGNGTRTSSRTTNKSYPYGYDDIFRLFGGGWLTACNFGQFDNIRISNVARYVNSTYTVPTTSFTSDANTRLLLKGEGTAGSQDIADTF